ncbi:carboxylesterase 5A-like [Lineus longissimus]|uniref:carboxylesterase 5A-like n=1 Tax=Lineus longissimus TaxID=88925 RepID=UPI00315CF75C
MAFNMFKSAVENNFPKLILLLSLTGLISAANNPFFVGYNTVETNAGTIKGSRENISSFGKTYEYFVYRGIRYAKNPTGDLRFARPVPVDKFQGVFDATEYTVSCPQSKFGFAIDSTSADPMYHQRTGEDCLSLNVFTPSDGGRGKPVMVYIYGGGWVVGSSQIYFGGLLAPFGDVVYVVMNFRLGAFGFLSTGDTNAPGNAAYFDQLLALKWVRNNIEAFGGDPDLVTIFGESAGGYDVTAHAISPLSGGLGLFKRVIAQSGVAVTPITAPMQINPQVPFFTKNLGYNLQCNDSNNPALTNSKLLVECLRKKSVEDIIKFTDVAGLPADAIKKGPALFGPVIDGDFFPLHPAALQQNPNLTVYKSFKDFDLLVSVNSNDGESMFKSLIAQGRFKAWGVPPPFLISKDVMHEQVLPFAFPPPMYPSGVARAVEQEYILDSDIANSSVQRRDNFIQAYTDHFFLAPSIAAANTHVLMQSPGPDRRKTFFFQFDHNSPVFPRMFGPGKATHGSDLFYTFGYAAMMDNMNKMNVTLPRNAVLTSVDVELAKAALTYFTNFAKFGNTNGNGTASPYPKWPPYTLEDKNYMNFGSNATSIILTASKDLRPRAAAFWIDYIPFVARRTCPKPQSCATPTCPPLLDQYIGYLRLTVGQAQMVIMIFAVATGVFGSVVLILLTAYCKLRHSLKHSDKMVIMK